MSRGSGTNNKGETGETLFYLSKYYWIHNHNYDQKTHFIFLNFRKTWKMFWVQMWLSYSKNRIRRLSLTALPSERDLPPQAITVDDDFSKVF